MIRFFAVIITLIGIAEILLGAILFTSGFAEIAQMFQEGAAKYYSPEESQLLITTWTNLILISKAFLPIAGIASIVSGFGLFKYRFWACKLWVVVIYFSMAYLCGWLFLEFKFYSNFLGLASYITIILLFVISLWFFKRPSTRLALS